jgi:hypothetical protein
MSFFSSGSVTKARAFNMSSLVIATVIQINLQKLTLVQLHL